MATPPFDIDATKPADDDVQSQFPLNERAFRDTVESWLLVNHNNLGQHKRVEFSEVAAVDRPAGQVDVLTLWHENDSKLYARLNDDVGWLQIPMFDKDATRIPNAALSDIATGRIKGRKTAGTGLVEDLDAGDATSLLNVFTAGTSVAAGLRGLVPAPAAGYADAERALTPNGWVAPPGRPRAVVQDTKAEGTDGGTFTSGAWQNRDLNDQNFDPDDIVSLASDTMTLTKGTYIFHWSAPAYEVGSHQTRLRNTTDNLDYYGSSAVAGTTVSVSTVSEGWAYLTITGTKSFKLQHRCQTTKATSGFGLATPGFGGNSEVYAQVTIWKVG